MSLGEPRKRKVEINAIEEAHNSEVQSQLSALGELRSQNQAIRERSEGAIKQSLAGAFEALHTVTARVLQSDDAGWNLRVQNDLQAIRDAVEGARVAAEEALRDMSGKSTEMREEEEKVRLLAMKHRAYLKSLESELPIVQRSENTFWKEAAEAREALTLWNKQVARRKEELHNMSWFRRLITNTAEMKRQLKIKQATELKSQQEHDRTSWGYIYTRSLRVRAAAVLVAERDRISLLEKARKESGEDKTALLDLQTALADVYRDVAMLEACARLPGIDFGRLDSLKCVLQLLGSEHMAQVGVCADVRGTKEAITSACRGRLAGWEWEQVQRPYQYPFSNLADIDSAGAGVTDSVGKADDVTVACNCPDCLAAAR